MGDCRETKHLHLQNIKLAFLQHTHVPLSKMTSLSSHCISNKDINKCSIRQVFTEIECRPTSIAHRSVNLLLLRAIVQLYFHNVRVPPLCGFHTLISHRFKFLSPLWSPAVWDLQKLLHSVFQQLREAPGIINEVIYYISHPLDTNFYRLLLLP